MPSPVVPDSPFVALGDTHNYLGKGWDDRVGCAVLIEAMRRTAKSHHANQLVYVATVQEEVGLRGAQSTADAEHCARLATDLGVALSVERAQRPLGRLVELQVSQARAVQLDLPA